MKAALPFLLLPLGFAAAAHAEVRSGDAVVVAAGQTVDGNLYARGGSVVVHGTVLGDLVVAGGTLIVDGHVAGDVLSAGGETTVAGPVDGDVRALGGRVAVLGPVRGDVAMAGGDLDVEGTVGGDALVAAGQAHIAGRIDGSLYAGAGGLRLDGDVARDLWMNGGTLALGPRADVGGDVGYTGTEGVLRAPGAVVGGQVVERPPLMAPVSRHALWLGWFQALVGSFLLGLVLLFLFRGFADRSTRALTEHPGRSAGFGALVLFGAPLVLALALAVGAVVGGWWIALFGGALYAMGVALTFPLVAAAAGAWLFARLKLPATASWVPMTVTLVVLFLVMRVPLLGGLTSFAVILFGLGAAALALVPTLRHTRLPSPPSVADAPTSTPA